MKSECEIDELLTVGTNKNVTTINQAIDRAYDDYTIIIDTGTYNEYLDLTTKKLNLLGLGDRESIIRYSTAEIAKKTIDIATNSTFVNLTISNTSNAGDGILQIVGCNPVFTNCLINRSTILSNAILINTASNVVITDTSMLNFEGNRWKSNLTISGTAEAILDVNEFWTNSTGIYGGLIASGTSVINLTINIREIYFNPATGLESVDGYGANSYTLSDNAKLTLSGNQITGGTRISGDGVVCLYKNIISTLGNFWCEIYAGVTLAVVTFDNCQIYKDVDSDATGLHILEDVGGCLVNIINGSILEFSGHSGNWFTMGNPIVSIGKLYIRSSSIIDNVNDNIPLQ